METSSLPPDEADGAAAAPPSLGNCLVNVIAAPGEVFERLRPAPARVATWLVPALLLIVVSWIGSAIVVSQGSLRQQLDDTYGKAIQQQVDAGKMPEAQADQARAVVGFIVRVAMVAGPVFVAILTPFWGGLILWIIGVKILKGSCSYRKAVEVAGLANMIGVLSGLLKPLLILATNNLFAGTNPALLIPDFDPTNSLHGVLANLDVMTFWVLLVRGLGIAKVSGVSTGKAVGWTFGFWILITGSLIGLGLAWKLVTGG